MKTRKPLRRSTTPIKRSRVKPSNPKRRKKAFARSYGSPARVEFVKAMACIVGRIQEYPKCHGPIENAHTKSGGAGRKADAKHTVPLCGYHHIRLHTMGARLFQLGYGVNLEQEAEKTELAWQLATHGVSTLEQQAVEG